MSSSLMQAYPSFTMQDIKALSLVQLKMLFAEAEETARRQKEAANK